MTTSAPTRPLHLSATDSEMSADETLFRLALFDWPAEAVSVFWNAGCRNPDDARTWNRNGLTADVIVLYTRVGLDRVDEMVKHHRANLPPDVVAILNAAGITDPVAQRRSTRSGLTGVAIDRYRALGVTNYDHMKVLHDAKTPRHHIADCVAAGLIDPNLIAALYDAGINTPSRYIDAGFTDAATMLRLQRHGVSSHDAYWFTQAGFHTEHEMVSCRAAGIRGEDANWFTRSGVHDPAEMADLIRHGVTGAHAARYTRHFTHDTSPADWPEIKRICDSTNHSGTDFLNAVSWIGLTTVDDLRDAAAAGLTGTKINNYYRHGFTGRDVITLARAGLSGPAAARLRDTDPDRLAAILAGDG